MTVPVPDQLEFISVADGVTRDFPYPKRFLQADEIKVLLRDANGIDTPQYLGQHFSIAGNSWPNGGAVSFYTAPPSGSSVVRYRATQAKQTVDLENKQRNDAKAVEVQLDRLAMIGQDVQASNARGLRLPVGDAPNALPPKNKRAGKILSFDATGQPEAAVTKVDVETVAHIAANVSIVAGIASDVTAVAANRTNINKVAAIDTAITSVAAIASDIPTVVIMRPNIETVVSEKANIATVALYIGNVDKVAVIDQAVAKVAAIDAAVSKVSGISADVTKVSGIAPAVSTVADDRLTIAAVAGNKANIDAVAANKPNIDAVVANATIINAVAGNAANISAVAANGSDIDLVAANMPKVNTVAGIAPQVAAVAAIAPEVAAVGAVASSVPVVAAIDDKVAAVAANAANVTAVANNKANIDAVAGNKTNIDAVKNNATNINAVAADKANIDAVASSKTDIGTVAANITAVNNASTNMPAIIAAPTKAQEAAQSATDAAESKRLAELVTANMKGGVAGQILMKLSGDDYAYKWETPTSGGDVFKSVIDPKGKNADAYNMANFDEAANAKVMTAGERTKLAGISVNATANTGTVTSVAVAVLTGFTVTPAITTSGTITIGNASGYQAYTTAEAQKLSGIAAGADKTPVLALVATSGAYGDLSGRPAIPAAQVQTDWNAASGLASIANKPVTFPPSAHSHTKDQVGLSNVDNTSDANKQVSTAQAAALNGKLDKNAQAADSAKLNGKDEAGLVASGPIAAAIAAAGNWPGVYSGSDPSATNFPIGHIIFCWNAGTISVNQVAIPRINPSEPQVYGVGASGALLSGVWRSRGRFSPSSPIFILQRTEQ